MSKEYVHKEVKFAYNPKHRKWNFQHRGYSLVTGIVGGAEAAKTVAGIVCGALKRTKGQGLDGLARKNMEPHVYC